MRLQFNEIKDEIRQVFEKYGMSPEKAETCARIHTESTYDGIYSHGTNRVARFVDYIQKGWVDIDADPTLEKDLGALKVFNGHMGPGILNALHGVEVAMKMAEEYGIGMVGVKNHHPLDAWWHLWFTRSQQRLCRYHVDQYRIGHATLGRKRLQTWQQPFCHGDTGN